MGKVRAKGDKMTQRSFDDAFWNDPFIQDLPKDAKFLFAYLWTNNHCNAAGIYEITPRTISFETGIEKPELNKLFPLLDKKVKWLPDCNLVWVRNFVKRQSKSPKFLIAVAECLHSIHQNGLIQEYLEYNGKLGISIPYLYPIGNVSIPNGNGIDTHTVSDTISDTDSNTDTKEGRGKKVAEVFARLDKERGYRPPKRKAEAVSIIRMLKDHTPDDIIKTWQSLKAESFWHDKELYMMTVESQIGAKLNGRARPNQGGHYQKQEQTHQSIPGNRPAGAFDDIKE